MKKLYIVSIFLLSMFLSYDFAEAQNRRRGSRISKQKNRMISRYRGGSVGDFSRKRYISIGGSLSAFNYFGDLAPKPSALSTDISFTRPGIGIVGLYRFGPRYSVRGTLSYGRLKGDDFDSADPADENARYRYVRNLQFRNNIFELAVTGVVDIIPNMGTFVARPTFVPYVFGGLAVFYHNPQALVPETDVNNGNAAFENAGQWVDLEPLGTEGQYISGSGVSPYKKIQIAIPLGIGVRYRVNHALDLSFEIGYRQLFFDYIDDVSGNYVDLGLFTDDLTRALSDRSREANAVESGEVRDLSVANRIITYTGADGRTYQVIAGYGDAHPESIRGNASDNDIYVVTSFQLTYILGGSLFGGAKYR
ncbi:DUF6089 family protein [Fulvivirgaceae bacterium BMA10]|uniref:DUF6089 family protein n=1 Tax=Splendidivirga corallicola TaxID=3051826 RepID=A0ABT8KPD4_9BACT|nr:DUF6089 family protein [Fulvivirgaceae bacterium BMA10]